MILMNMNNMKTTIAIAAKTIITREVLETKDHMNPKFLSTTSIKIPSALAMSTILVKDNIHQRDL